MDIIENKKLSRSISPRTYFANIAKYTEIDKNLFCAVCGDLSNGKHYGILSCNGCSGFFKRSVRRKLIYHCQSNSNMCIIDKIHRNQCQSCRFKKCLQMGMIKEAVQNERQSRNNNPSYEEEDRERLISLFYPYSSEQTNIFMIKHNKYDLDDTISSQILLMIIKWIHNLPTFLNLPIHDQIILIEESWGELFLLLAIQYSISLDIFNHIFHVFKQLKIDPIEFECLKIIIFYRFDNRGLKEIKTIENLQDQALITLAQFQKPIRFGRLLLTLSLFGNISSKFIEKTYFSHIISHISISKFLVNMLKNK